MDQLQFETVIQKKEEEIASLKKALQDTKNKAKQITAGKDFVKKKVKFHAKWMSPQGEKHSAIISISVPKVRVNSEVVLSESLMKLANGAVLTEEELTFSPALRGFSQVDAARLLSKWTQMKVGYIEVVSSE
ncbi:MAG: hypothetical protein AAF502_25680 [Bacteroidota bacterium]